jgi:CDP-diacylglycerol--serine O-phosphatidyltransferase
MSTREPRRHFSLFRTFVLADVLTIANASAGTTAIFLCLAHLASHQRTYLWWAIGLLPVALVCDALDGAVARWRKRHSPLGADLDSLADVVSFGVAPAVLGFTVGLDGAFDAVVLVYFVACGISRLARYNVTSASIADDSGKVPYYEGTPIPTSLALVAMLGVLLALGRTHDTLLFGELHLGPWTLHPLVLAYAVSGSLMISATIRIPKP